MIASAWIISTLLCIPQVIFCIIFSLEGVEIPVEMVTFLVKIAKFVAKNSLISIQIFEFEL